MEHTQVTVVDAICGECPYCHKDFLIMGADLNDLTAPDFEEGEKEECPHCHKEFIYTMEE